jgi:lysyl-tRNA synthetase class 2
MANAGLEALRAADIDPYPPRVTRTHSAAEANDMVEALPEGETEVRGIELDVTGRVMARRDMGKATFVDLQDGTGRIQVLFRQNALDHYDSLKLIDLGDFIGAHGAAIRTRTGQPTVAATEWTMLAKALYAPPEKYHGLQDAELRQRKRYLDLMANEETRRTFTVRSKVVSAIRRFLDGRGFLEVETPILQESAGGAAARPFLTHFNALDEDRALRISLELHLKRLVVGGFDKVYEIGRNFRNEGMDWKHNPEFTMLETYEAYADYHDVARMVEEMISLAAREVLGHMTFSFRGHEIDLTPPWRRVTLHDALREYGGLDLEEFSTETLSRDAPAERIATQRKAGR